MTLPKFRWQWLGPWLGLACVVLLFLVMGPSNFRTWYNAKTIITQSAIVGIGALGMTLVVISGGIDLSVGSLIALTTVVVATCLNHEKGPDGTCSATSAAVAACAGMLVSTVCGAVSGSIVAYLRVVPFIATLGMMQIARGVAKWIADEQTVRTPNNFLKPLMDVDPTPAWLQLAPGVWMLVLLVVGVWFILKYTVFGRHVFAIGSNEQTARLCGVNVRGRRVAISACCGLLTGIAGVMQYSRLTVGDPTAAVGMELDIIAAVVIGGGSLSGGVGSALGSLVGALMIGVLRNGCNLMGVYNYVQEIIVGVIIICAVLIDRWRRHSRESI